MRLCLYISSQTKSRNKRVFYYCQTSVLFLYNGGIFNGYPSLLAFHLSGTPSLMTGTRPASCLHLNNHPYVQDEFIKQIQLVMIISMNLLSGESKVSFKVCEHGISCHCGWGKDAGISWAISGCCSSPFQGKGRIRAPDNYNWKYLTLQFGELCLVTKTWKIQFVHKCT